MLFRLAGEIKHSLVNGPGIRYVVFFQGCPHHCEGCQNPETHDISGGMEADTDDVMERIRKAKFLDGVTLSGGDPLMQPEACGSIARAVHEMGLSVWVYTGWTMDDILHDTARKRLYAMWTFSSTANLYLRCREKNLYSEEAPTSDSLMCRKALVPIRSLKFDLRIYNRMEEKRYE